MLPSILWILYSWKKITNHIEFLYIIYSLGSQKYTLWIVVLLIIVFMNKSWSVGAVNASNFMEIIEIRKKTVEDHLISTSFNFSTTIKPQKTIVSKAFDNISVEGLIHSQKEYGEILGTAAAYKLDVREPSIGCALSEFTCSNGNCIPSVKFCDRFNDCNDNSDEPRLCTRKWEKLCITWYNLGDSLVFLIMAFSILTKMPEKCIIEKIQNAQNLIKAASGPPGPRAHPS